MKRARILMAATCVAGAATGAVAVALPSSASATTHTLTFLAVQNASHQFDKTHFIGQDKDKHNGTLIGLDTIDCVAQSNGASATCDVAASYKGGQIFGSFTESFKSGKLTGTVTGGTRSFQGATGTITGSSQSKTTTKVTVTYHT